MNRRQDNEYIKAIISAGSISSAAENLGISQPALSAFLRKKESELGATIFDRSTLPVKLTGAGHIYNKYLDTLALINKELEQGLVDVAELKTGTLVVGGASFFNVAYLPEAVAQFVQKYPGVKLEIIDGDVPHLMNAAQRGDLDLFITPKENEDDRFTYEEFHNESIYLCVPAKWKENTKLCSKRIPIDKIMSDTGNGNPVLTSEEFQILCERIFVVLKPNQHIGKIMNNIFEECGCRPTNTVTVEQTMTSLALTRAGVGVSLITGSSIRHSDVRDELVFYQVHGGLSSRKMYVAYLKNKYMSHAASEFLSILKTLNA